MRSIWVITKRELASYFDSLIAYLIIIIFLIITGIFTWLYGNTIFLRGQADLGAFFDISYWWILLFIPAITMRSLAEEKKSGTIELLSTKAVSDWEIVLGKFFGAALLWIIALICTIPYYITVASLGEVDHGAIVGGYLGLILTCTMYISLGIFTSSTTDNQIIAFLIALFIGAFFLIIFQFIGSLYSGHLGTLLDYLSIRSHYDSLSRGVFDTRDIIYFGSFIIGFLVLSQTMLSKRNWHN